MNWEELGSLFKTAEHTIFRLETLQVYTVPAEVEALKAFREGRPRPALSPESQAWFDMMAARIAEGIRWYRVHVVDWPLTEYVRWELQGYGRSVAFGHEIHIAERGTHPDLEELHVDFWAFDLDDPERAVVAVMHYDDEGHFLGAERADQADLDTYRNWRDVALAHAVPWEEYTKDLAERSA